MEYVGAITQTSMVVVEPLKDKGSTTFEHTVSYKGLNGIVNTLLFAETYEGVGATSKFPIGTKVKIAVTVTT